MIDLSQEETQQVAADMETMVEYIDKLQELDTRNVEPMSHVLPMENVFREDVVTGINEQEQMLCNAPKQEKGMFVVPGTLKQ